MRKEEDYLYNTVFAVAALLALVLLYFGARKVIDRWTVPMERARPPASSPSEPMSDTDYPPSGLPPMQLLKKDRPPASAPPAKPMPPVKPVREP
ncbi:MAG: hypothetical protein AAB339_03490 [Elusimicrobiota bacterium]